VQQQINLKTATSRSAPHFFTACNCLFLHNFLVRVTYLLF